MTKSKLFIDKIRYAYMRVCGFYTVICAEHQHQTHVAYITMMDILLAKFRSDYIIISTTFTFYITFLNSNYNTL